MNLHAPCRVIFRSGLFGLCVLGGVACLRGAPDMMRPPVEVEIPALITTESTAWLHASWEGVEVLSLSSEESTRVFVQNIATQRANLAAILPADFRVTWTRPISVVLYGHENPRPMPTLFVAILSKKLTDKERAQALEDRSGKPLHVIASPRITPGTWVADADSVCVFNLVPTKIKPSELSELPAPVYVTYLMQARTPPLPKWLIEGVMILIGQATVTGSDMDVPPSLWISGAQTQLMLKDRSIAAEFVPWSQVFAYVNAATAPKDERQRQIVRSQAALLVRWAFEGKAPGGAEALWKFARGKTTGPGADAWFEECFGMAPDTSLGAFRTYLTTALKRPMRVRLTRDTRLPSIEIRPATISEIARLKGEWERLSGRLVATENPELRPFYDENARRTLKLGPDNTAADPELLAARALMATELGNDEAALPLLEAACAAPKPRPRAVVELARIRLAQAKAGLAAGAKLDEAAVTAIVAPLRGVLDFQPPMPRAFQLLAEAWSAAGTPPPEGDIAAIMRGAQTIPGDAALIVASTRLLLDVGRPTDARDAVEAGLAHVTDESGRRRLYAIRSAVRAALPK